MIVFPFSRHEISRARLRTEEIGSRLEGSDGDPRSLLLVLVLVPRSSNLIHNTPESHPATVDQPVKPIPLLLQQQPPPETPFVALSEKILPFFLVPGEKVQIILADAAAAIYRHLPRSYRLKTRPGDRVGMACGVPCQDAAVPDNTLNGSAGIQPAVHPRGLLRIFHGRLDTPENVRVPSAERQDQAGSSGSPADIRLAVFGKSQP